MITRSTPATPRVQYQSGQYWSSVEPTLPEKKAAVSNPSPSAAASNATDSRINRIAANSGPATFSPIFETNPLQLDDESVPPVRLLLPRNAVATPEIPPIAVTQVLP